MAGPNRTWYRLQWRLHKLVWSLSGGRLGRRAVGMPVLELITIGRTSGEPRSVLLTHLEHPDGWVVIGSNLGSDRHPAWWLNLQAEPRARVRVGGARCRVEAEELTGEERAAAWDRAVAVNPGYGDYPESTERSIPVVLLRRL